MYADFYEMFDQLTGDCSFTLTCYFLRKFRENIIISFCKLKKFYEKIYGYVMQMLPRASKKAVVKQPILMCSIIILQCRF